MKCSMLYFPLTLLVIACAGCPGAPENYTIAVYLTGNGTVTLNPPGGVYESGTTVTLTAAAAAGWHFDHWEGGATGSANPSALTITADTLVTAVFVVDPPGVDLNVRIFGKGEVTLDPPGGTYPAGSTVTLTPVPGGPAWTFDHWVGGLGGSASPATVTVAEDTDIMAVFRNGEGLVMQVGYAQLKRMAASPDGSMVVTGSADGVVRVWDPETGLVTNSIYENYGYPVNTVAFSADGAQLMTSTFLGGAELYDVSEVKSANAAKTRVLRRFGSGSSHGLVRATAFSPLGTSALLGFDDGFIAEVNLVTGDPVTAYASHAEGVAAVAYSADAERLVSASYDGTAAVFLSGVPLPVRTFVHPDDVYAAAFIPGGDEIVTGCADGNVRVCHIGTGAMTILAGHIDGVLSVAVSPDGTKALSGSMDKTAIVWDLVTRTQLYILTGHDTAIPSVCFTKGGDEMFTADRETVTRWDVATRTETATMIGHVRTVNSAEFSPNETRIVTCGDKNARLYDVATGDLLHMLRGHIDTVKSVAFSPDGAHVATGSFDNTIRIWNADTGELDGEIDTGQPVHAVDISPDGTQLAAGLRSNTASTWDIATGDPENVLIGHTERVVAVAYSHDGTFIATGSHDDTAKLWNAATGVCLQTYTEASNDITSVAFSLDDTRLVVGSFGGAFRIYDVGSGMLVFGLPPTTFGPVYEVDYAPDGLRVLTGNTLLGHLWDADGIEIPTNFYHYGQVLTVDYSPGGVRVLTGGEDGATKIWLVE